MVKENIFVDRRDVTQMVDETHLGPEESPVAEEEQHRPWCDELLKCPSPCKPPARVKHGATIHLEIVGSWDIKEIDVAHSSFAIPLEHRVDRLRQLGTALLVDAARVNPYPAVSMRSC